MVNLLVLATCLASALSAAVLNAAAPVDDGAGDALGHVAERSPSGDVLPGIVLETFLDDVADVWHDQPAEPETYIVGGKIAQPGAWPWQASLRHRSKHQCGGVVLGPRWVLTSAGCLDTMSSPPTVILGLHDQRHAKNLPEYTVADVVTHGGYSKAKTPENDLALLHLDQAAELNVTSAGAIALPEADQDFPHSANCFISGWGQVSRFLPARPSILQEAKVKVFDNARCRRAWRWFSEQIYSGNICVGRYLRASACAGDEGGPLMCKVGGAWRLAGVASWTGQFCPTVMPSVYTRVTEYRQWIADVTGI